MNAGTGTFSKTATVHAPFHGKTRIGSAPLNAGSLLDPFNSFS